MNFRLVAKILGLLAILVGFAMAACWGYARLEAATAPEGEDAGARALGLSSAIVLAFGALLHLCGLGGPREVLRREAIVVVGLGWILVGLLGSLPYMLCDPGLAPVPAIFESVSGFTTTGASTMTDIEAFPRPILLWRSVTQWLGGIGILVVFVAVLSFLGVGSRALVQQESSLNLADSGASRVRDIAKSLLWVYLGLTAACALGLLGLGMDAFDALCHAMCTIATGGFSTKNASVGHYGSLGIEMWISLFMFLSAIGFMLYLFVLRGKWARLRSEEEARYYFLLIAFATLSIALDLCLATDEYGYRRAFKEAFFNVVSIGSTTGFANSDYDQWPLFSKMMLMVMMLIGGCAGSTAGGIKMNRVILFYKTALREMVRTFRPSQVFRIKLNGVSPDEQVFATTSFLISLGFGLSGISVLLVALLEPQLSMISAIGSVFATLFNIGPGFEAVGPTQNFAFLKAPTQLLLSFLMVLGRLEFLAILVLFVPALWRKY
jgi:trk system potassium uptake protein TrkH